MPQDDSAVPSGDTPYARAKRAMIGDRSKGITPDLPEAERLLREAIAAGERVSSAVKDLAVVMKRTGRAADAADMICEMRHLCGDEIQQTSLDNMLYDLYTRSDDWASAIAIQERHLQQNDTDVAHASQHVVSGLPLSATRDDVVAMVRRIKLQSTFVCTVVRQPSSGSASVGMECGTAQAAQRLKRDLPAAWPGPWPAEQAAGPSKPAAEPAKPAAEPAKPAAGPAEPAAGLERRRAADGGLYTREEFLSYFGRPDEWNAAPPAPPHLLLNRKQRRQHLQPPGPPPGPPPAQPPTTMAPAHLARVTGVVDSPRGVGRLAVRPAAPDGSDSGLFVQKQPRIMLSKGHKGWDTGKLHKRATVLRLLGFCAQQLGDFARAQKVYGEAARIEDDVNGDLNFAFRRAHRMYIARSSSALRVARWTHAC